MRSVALIVMFAALGTLAWSGEKEHAHEHVAPHKGTLLELGAEYAHLEFVLGADGKLTAYVLDGEAEKAVRVKQEEIELHVTQIGGQKADAKINLLPVADVLTGEKKGDSSQFAAQADALKGAAKFLAAVARIEVKGKEFKNVELRFPEGNEGEVHKK